ncbi:Ctr copper transporter family-domain-containing protein [Mycena galericulata]|nr:Ctr copper transporter family-domain-containing protein [Mycena galericulata]
MAALHLKLLFTLVLPLLACADTNGMDMSMDDGMTLANGTMMTVLHFTLGDTIWFAGWVPQTRGAMAGACIGLLILALVDRWLAAVRAMMELHWREAGERLRKANELKGRKDGNEKEKRSGIARMRLRTPPFVPAHDIMRGVMHSVQAALAYAFMLVIMTFQGAYIITIVLGLGIGQMLFGRYAGAAAAAH